MNEVRNRFAAIVVFVVIGVWSCASTFAQTQGNDYQVSQDTRTLIHCYAVRATGSASLDTSQLAIDAEAVPAKRQTSCFVGFKRLR